MTWRDELRPASFRGVPFAVESVGTTHELFRDEQHFPGRERAGDAVHVEPLGAGPERFKVDAFVVGDNYHEARDALVAALKEPGNGRLVHPYRGERVVAIVGHIQVTESKRTGGYARIAFEAVETETPRLRRSPDTAAVVAADLDAFLDALAADFEETYDEDAAEEVQASSVDAFDDAVETLGDVYSSVLSGIGEVQDFARDAGEFTSDVTRFAAAPFEAATALVGALGVITSVPERLVLGVSSAVEAGGRSVVDALMGALAPLVRFGEELAAISTTTPTRQRESDYRDATLQLIRGAALAQLIRGVAALPFDSRTHATEVRDELLDDLDWLVTTGSAGGDTVSGAVLYESLAAVRASTAAHLARVARSLPELETYVVTADLPALVIAHRLYGDARQAEDLVARNDPPRPGWIPRGTELEVIRRG